MKGWPLRGAATPDGEDLFCRRVMCATILRAIAEDDRAWLESTGRSWCELLGVPVDSWTGAAERLTAVQREWQPVEDAERFRQYRAAKRDDPAYQERQRERWRKTNEKRRAERAQKRAQGR